MKLQRLTYHLTGKTKDQLWTSTPMQLMWKELGLNINYLCKTNKIEVISFVLMRNHYHLLCISKPADIKKLITGLKPNIYSNIKIQFINSQIYLKNCYLYIYQNPKRANLVSRIENYPYSTLFNIAKATSPLFPLSDRFGPPDEYKLHLLNKPISNRDITNIKGLNAWKIS